MQQHRERPQWLEPGSGESQRMHPVTTIYMAESIISIKYNNPMRQGREKLLNINSYISALQYKQRQTVISVLQSNQHNWATGKILPIWHGQFGNRKKMIDTSSQAQLRKQQCYVKRDLGTKFCKQKRYKLKKTVQISFGKECRNDLVVVDYFVSVIHISLRSKLIN